MTEYEKLIEQLKYKIDTGDYLDTFKKDGISGERVDLLINAIKEERKLPPPYIWDINLYAIKKVLPREHKLLSPNSHCYSSCSNYEYDPSKNGINIIKHGLSFGEVASYSKNFGTLIVPCPDEKDGERSAIFSELNLTKERELTLPLPNIDPEEHYILSITTNRSHNFRGGRLRFISSRFINKKNLENDLQQALKNIYPKDKDMRKKFIADCIHVLQRNTKRHNNIST